MKVLLSAYACAPYRGSEPAVGWNWAQALAAADKEVWVLTRVKHKVAINDYFKNHARPPNLHFIFYDLPKKYCWWKKNGRFVRFYYLLWQWGAYQLAKAKHAELSFDLVHHVTFVGMRQPSFMGNLGIEFIFGPVAGGESAPFALRKGYGFRNWLTDAIRDLLNWLVKFDPLMRRTFAQAKNIYVTSLQSKALIPAKFTHKTQVRLAIGIDTKNLPIGSNINTKSPLKLLFIGRFLYWKGLNYALFTLQKLHFNGIDAELTLVGQGPEELKLRRLADKLGISHHLKWIPWGKRAELDAQFLTHDIFLFPSLHDSGGMVVLEAMARGMPVVCMNIGGPGLLVNETCGHKIAVQGQKSEQIIASFVVAIKELNNSREKIKDLGLGARARAESYSWGKLAASIYG